jgi:hypothetical protein
VEFQQLVARYPYAVDMHGGDGSAYAALFPPAGSIGTAAWCICRTTRPRMNRSSSASR